MFSDPCGEKRQTAWLLKTSLCCTNCCLIVICKYGGRIFENLTIRLMMKERI